MNAELRQKLEQEVKNQRVRLFLQTEKEAWGMTVREEKMLFVNDLSDKELACLKSALTWGLKDGLLQEDLESRRIQWEC